MISVCMATYNGEKYIREQIDSILAQIGDNDELIISDDGSSDNTIAIIESYKDDRIKVLYNFGKHGFIGNFENALKHATGDYIFLSDQDDVWFENKVIILEKLLEKYDLINHDLTIVNEQLDIIAPSLFSKQGCRTKILSNIINSSFYGSCMAFRRSLLDIALPLCNYKDIGHDQWIGFVALLTGRVLFLDKQLIKYRRSNSTVTQLGNFWTRSKRPLYRKIYSRIIIIIEIFRFWISYRILRNRNNINI